MYGAVLASCDRRVAAYVLMAGTKSFSDWFLLGSKLEGDARAAVVRELAVLDPSRHAGAIAPAPVLFQFARKDEIRPRGRRGRLLRRGSRSQGAALVRLRPRPER